MYVGEILISMILGILAVWDWRKKELPVLLLIVSGLGIGIAGMVWLTVSWESRGIGLLPGVALMVISLLSKGQVGLADGVVFAFLGAATGIEKTLAVLLYSLALAALVGAISMLWKKKKGKDTLPFLPMVLAGYLGMFVTVLV
ncbi:MAG: prepilin peptidase [Lachnospiraceae bacterium]|nr:prepilin peptidase [Lachnospiraceae bacterium]